MRKTLYACLLMLAATAAFAFPTKVKVLKEPNFMSSDGTEVVLTTNKGTVTVPYKHRAYNALKTVKKGQCLNLETDSESEVEFNLKVDQSGLSAVFKVAC